MEVSHLSYSRQYPYICWVMMRKTAKNICKNSRSRNQGYFVRASFLSFCPFYPLCTFFILCPYVTYSSTTRKINIVAPSRIFLFCCSLSLSLSVLHLYLFLCLDCLVLFIFLSVLYNAQDKHPCPRRDSNSQSQQAIGRRPTT